MIIYVNGQQIDSTAINLTELLQELNYTQNWLATAVNNNLVHSEKRTEYILKENDKIEILSPMQGG